MNRSSYPYPPVAREGWPFLFPALTLSLLLTPLGTISLPFWLLTLFLLQFFRDPPRAIPSEPNLLLSPADGRIIAIEPALDPWRRTSALKISIFMNIFNVHVNRSPIAGHVVARYYHPGTFLNATLDKASHHNERNVLLLRTESGHELTMVQIAGLIARRILCYVQPGHRVSPGQRIGFIRFGSRVDLYLPPTLPLAVSLGQKVFGGVTILAHLPSSTPSRDVSPSLHP
ncbi:MAG: phosphatidylserine decarboxylase [Hydrogenophilus sp.]|nr:phosphatidylserine decarboxylase [Hydrogenophilus sp.]